MVAPVNTTNSSNKVKPPFKWVGGKRQLLHELIPRLPKEWNTYYEPFLGGGALFFSLQPGNAVLTDVNNELINAYKCIRYNVDDLIKELKKHKNTEEYFYQIRNADRNIEYEWYWNPLQKAARFIYLNKTCFNGLYRENSRKFFNTPFGHYNNPKIVDEENLRSCSLLLNSENLTLLCRDYHFIENKIKEGDFVYLDPPYIPLSISSSFTAYNKDGFTIKNQQELLSLCDKLTSLGINWMQSNSSAPIVFEMYKKYHIEEVIANRNVSASNQGRKQVKEVIIRNYK